MVAVEVKARWCEVMDNIESAAREERKVPCLPYVR